MNEIQVGLIGCGRIAGRHVNWFNDAQGCSITAVSDISEDAAQTRANEILKLNPGSDVSVYTDYKEMLEDPALDGVAILLPHGLHFQVGMDALNADKHVLMEKPMVTSVDDAQALILEARKRKKVLGIGYQRSYLSEYSLVRRMIADGEFGEIQFVSGHLEQAWYANFTDPKKERTWKSDPEGAGGGQLVDTGSHTVAALFDVTQLNPVEVFAFMQNLDIPVDVNTASSIRFENGAVGTLTVGGFGHSVTEVLRVVGEKKSARIFFRTVAEQSLEIDGEIIDAKTEYPASTPNADFISAIQNEKTMTANGELGLKVAQFSEACYDSAKEKRPVTI